MSILVVADHDNESIKAPTLVSVAAAQQIGGDIDVLLPAAAVLQRGMLPLKSPVSARYWSLITQSMITASQKISLPWWPRLAVITVML